MKNVIWLNLFVFSCFFSTAVSSRLQAQECLSGGCTISATQYPPADQSTTSATFVTVSTLIYAGEWQRYSVTAGAVYEWSLCSADGGSASYDSQLTLYQDDGSTILCYSDDNCSDDGKIRWTATYTGFARTQVNVYNCATNAVNTTLVWRRVSAPVTLNCGSAVALSCGVGVTSGNLATSGGIYDPPSTTCGFSTPGNEKLYSFTSTAAGTYTLQVTNVNGGTGYIDYFFKTAAGGCGNAGWTCIGDRNAPGSLTFTLAASTAYYILLDAESAASTANHTFQINCPAGAPANDLCASATSIVQAQNTSVTYAGTNASATASSPTLQLCGNSSPGVDVWYAFSSTATGTVQLNVESDGTNGSTSFDSQIQVFSGGCPGAATSCVAQGDDGGNPIGDSDDPPTINLAATAGTAYRVRVYNWSSSGTGAFNLQIITPAGLALPIELQSFTGKTLPKSNVLQWETLTEKNVQWHIVERSIDGVNWSETGRKTGQMDSHVPMKYELEDRTPPAKSYYRLRSIDFDGAENLSGAILLSRKTEHFGITAAFPSPAKDQLTLQFESLTEENVTIRITDFTGRMVLEQEYAAENGNNEVPVKLSGLQAGVYLIGISNEDSRAEPLRIVKE